MAASGGSLLDIPTWDQNRDPLPDGQQDPFHATDCGEECAAMRIYYRTGIELPAGVLRTLIPDKTQTGATTGPELVRLMRQFGLRPVWLRVTVDAIQGQCQRSVTLNVPPIVLGNWVAPTVPHWILLVDAMATGVVVNDPWGGRRYFLPWNLFLQRYLGECIV